MLRITPEAAQGMSVTLRLEGRIVDAWVEALRQSCGRCLACDQAVVLELSGVTFLDFAGAELLVHLREGGVRLREASPFLLASLERAAATNSDSRAKPPGV